VPGGAARTTGGSGRSPHRRSGGPPMRIPRVSRFRALGALALGLLAACGGGGGGGGGSGTLQVRMRDTPVDSAEHVFVTIKRVEVFRSDATGNVRETLVD